MPFTVTESEKQELAVVYAALVLYDDKAPITSDNISKILSAAKGTEQLIYGVALEVEPYWPKLFANLLATRDIGDLLTSGGAAPVSAAPAAGAPAAAGAAKVEAKKEEKVVEEEDDALDGGFSLFD